MDNQLSRLGDAGRYPCKIEILHGPSFMQTELRSDLDDWKKSFRDELSSHLATLVLDQDIYGFAIEPSEDLSSMHFITCVGRESNLKGEVSGSRAWLDRRYCHVEWDGYLPPSDFGGSLERLNAISEKYHDLLIDSDTCEFTEDGNEFRDTWYAEILAVMIELDKNGSFGNIWFKIISFSDFDHPIQKESFTRLNRDRALNDAESLFDIG